jgi:hypothetical protein
MNGLTAIAVAGLIAVAGVLWFQASPNVVTIKATPMQPNASLPTFRQVETDLQREQARP